VRQRERERERERERDPIILDKFLPVNKGAITIVVGLLDRV
jgi:hypothetical protein